MGLGGGGGAGEIDTSFIGEFASQANQILDDVLRAALPYAEFFTNKAIEASEDKFNTGIRELQKYYELGQAETAPYREGGYQAFDMYQDTLGMPRPAGGSSRLAAAQKALAKEQAAKQAMAAQASKMVSKMSIPVDQKMQIIRAATEGGNFEGLMQSLREFSIMNPNAFDRGSLSATAGNPNGTSHLPGAMAADPNRENPYNDVLSNTFNSFTPPNVLNNFLLSAMPIGDQLRRSRNSMTSSQRSLANSVNTGFPGI